jgi:hypothetical protein
VCAVWRASSHSVRPLIPLSPHRSGGGGGGAAYDGRRPRPGCGRWVSFRPAEPGGGLELRDIFVGKPLCDTPPDCRHLLHVHVHGGGMRAQGAAVQTVVPAPSPAAASNKRRAGWDEEEEAAAAAEEAEVALVPLHAAVGRVDPGAVVRRIIGPGGHQQQQQPGLLVAAAAAPRAGPGGQQGAASAAGSSAAHHYHVLVVCSSAESAARVSAELQPPAAAAAAAGGAAGGAAAEAGAAAGRGEEPAAGWAQVRARSAVWLLAEGRGAEVGFPAPAVRQRSLCASSVNRLVGRALA